jgi:hypothetical protein
MPAVEISGDVADLLHARDEVVGMTEVPIGIGLRQIFGLHLFAHRVGAAVGGVGRVVPVDAAVGRAHGRRLERPVAAGDLAGHAAGGREHRVTGRIDERLGADVAQTLDIADDRARDLVAFGIGVDDAGEIPDVDAGNDAILVEQALEGFRIERDPPVVVRHPVLRRDFRSEKSARVHLLDQFQREAADQRPGSVPHRAERVHQPGRRHAAKAPGRLDQQHLGAQPRSANRGRAAGRPSACHEDVVLILDGNAAGEGVGFHR